MRTLDEITADAKTALQQRDATSLLRCAEEARADGTDASAALSHRWCGEAARFLGDFALALEHFTQALTYYTSTSDSFYIASMQYARAIALANTNEYDAALESYTHALAGFIAGKHTKNVAATYCNIAVLYERMANFEKSVEYHSLALDHHNAETDPSGYAFVILNLGVVKSRMGHYVEALGHYHESLSIFESLSDNYAIGVVLGNLAIVHRTNGNYSVAVDYYNRAITICEEIQDHIGVAINKGNVGSIHSELGDRDTAIILLREAAVTHKAMGNRIGDAACVSSLASVLANSGRLEEALESFAYALAIQRELSNTPGIVHTLCNICLAMIDNDRPEEVHPFLDELMGYTIDLPMSRLELCVIHGRLAVLNKDYTSASKHYHSALAIAEAHDLRSSAADTHLALRDLAQLEGDFDAYIKHNTECVSIREGINGREASIKMALFSKEDEIKEKEKEHQKHMAVLHSTLPKHIADRVARGEVVNDSFENAAVLFLDIVGFTKMSSKMQASEVVELLDRLFAVCDRAMNTHGLMKIKTIGDSYMAASFDNVESAALAALDLVASVTEVQIRIGIHCGPVVAGVLGKERMQYDVWGDTVNIASRMESTSEPGRIHVSQTFATALNGRGGSPTRPYRVVGRGEIDIKGKGMMTTYWLEKM